MATKRFLAGFCAGVVVPILVVATFAQFGLMDVRADAPVPAFFANWYATSVHNSVRRQAKSVSSLPAASDADIIAGGKIYLGDCVGCHGERGKPPSDFGATFYPPAPQLTVDGTTYTEAEIFWVAKHGIRRTGMGAQASSYSDEKLRLLAAFIHRARTLSPQLLDAIQQKTGDPTQEGQAPK
jgi:mono/diheme cytochrome c family protein